MLIEELKEVISHTKSQIYAIKHQIAETTNPTEKRRLQHQLKKLQYLQLWNIDQLGCSIWK